MENDKWKPVIFNTVEVYSKRPPLRACYYEVITTVIKETLPEYLLCAREFTYITFNHYNTHANFISWFYKWGNQRLERFTGLSSTSHVMRAGIQTQLCLILKPVLFSVHQADWKPTPKWSKVCDVYFYSQNCIIVKSYRFQEKNLSHYLRGVSFLLNKGKGEKRQWARNFISWISEVSLSWNIKSRWYVSGTLG